MFKQWLKQFIPGRYRPLALRLVSTLNALRGLPAHVRFLSLEPLLGPLANLNLDGVDWVIVGGESGRSPRPLSESWVLDIQAQCDVASVPFFFKQWGGRNKKESGRVLNGRTWNAMPEGASAS